MRGGPGHRAGRRRRTGRPSPPRCAGGRWRAAGSQPSISSRLRRARTAASAVASRRRGRGVVVHVVGGDRGQAGGVRPARRARRCARRRAGRRGRSARPPRRRAPNRATSRSSSARAACLAAGGQRRGHVPLAAAGEHQHVVAQRLGHLLQVVDRAALLPAAQVRLGDGAGQPGVPLGPAGQHQQVTAGRVGFAVLRRRAGSSDSSAPNRVGRPSSRAASANRTTP